MCTLFFEKTGDTNWNIFSLLFAWCKDCTSKHVFALHTFALFFVFVLFAKILKYKSNRLRRSQDTSGGKGRFAVEI